MAESIEFRLKVIEDKLGIALSENEKKAKSLGNAISTAIGTLGGFVAAKALVSLSQGFNEVVRQSRDFSRAIAEINSVLPVGTKLTKDQEKALAQLSERYGTSATAQAKGFFEVVSNGIEDTGQAAKILAAANNAALSGLVELSTATQLITSAFNAYSSQGETAASITDTLVAVTQASGVKFEDLASTLGRVTNVAAQSGVSFGELGGTIAFLNQRSVTTEQAVTGLAGILAEISKPSQQASAEAAKLGISFNVASLKAKGLVPFLQEITDKTKGNVSSLRQLFGDQRAANAVIAIASSEFSKYASVVDKVTKSQGEAARASKFVKESLDFKLSILSNQFNSLAIDIGTKFIPIINNASNSFGLLRKILGTDTVKSLDENRNKLNALGLEYNSIIDRLVAYRKTQLGASSEAAKALEERLVGIRKEREEIKKSASVNGPDSEAARQAALARAASELEADTLIRQSRLDSYNQLNSARAEFDALNAQLDIDRKAITGEVTQADLDALIAAEKAKVDATFAAELQKTQLIQDEKARRDGLEAIDLKKQASLAASQGKREVDFKKSQLALERTFQDQKNAIILSGFGLASALAKDGSKEQFVIQKAAALAEIAIARGKAIALIPAQTAFIPYPGNIAPAAQLLANANIQAAIGAATVAASAIKGFAGGGIIGATQGPDNQLATVRTGEMVLNADQQGKLFNAINNGSFGGGEIVIQIDGRTIATAMRDQAKQGFKF
jgi:TP901 family phage tail tape measure protein